MAAVMSERRVREGKFLASAEKFDDAIPAFFLLVTKFLRNSGKIKIIDFISVEFLMQLMVYGKSTLSNNNDADRVEKFSIKYFSK
jgi:hypothetical protein